MPAPPTRQGEVGGGQRSEAKENFIWEHMPALASQVGELYAHATDLRLENTCEANAAATFISVF